MNIHFKCHNVIFVKVILHTVYILQLFVSLNCYDVEVLQRSADIRQTSVKCLDVIFVIAVTDLQTFVIPEYTLNWYHFSFIETDIHIHVHTACQGQLLSLVPFA